MIVKVLGLYRSESANLGRGLAARREEHSYFQIVYRNHPSLPSQYKMRSGSSDFKNVGKLVEFRLPCPKRIVLQVPQIRQSFWIADVGPFSSLQIGFPVALGHHAHAAFADRMCGSIRMIAVYED
jgi:hypothetical protein